MRGWVWLFGEEKNLLPLKEIEPRIIDLIKFLSQILTAWLTNEFLRWEWQQHEILLGGRPSKWCDVTLILLILSSYMGALQNFWLFHNCTQWTAEAGHLLHGANSKSFLRSRQLLSSSRNSQHFMESEGLLRALHWFLSWIIWIQSIPSHPISLT
jgi:hypothetical protein